MLAPFGVVSLLCDARCRPRTRHTEPLPVLRPSSPFSFAHCAGSLMNSARCLCALAACGFAALACNTKTEQPAPAPASSASGANAQPRASANTTASAKASDVPAPEAEAVQEPR